MFNVYKLISIVDQSTDINALDSLRQLVSTCAHDSITRAINNKATPAKYKETLTEILKLKGNVRIQEIKKLVENLTTSINTRKEPNYKELPFTLY